MLNMRIGWDLFMKIENIKLFTSEFEETFQFYEEILECPVRMISQEAFTVEIGETHLCFQQTNDDVQPFYHFAIDIPYNHFYDMKQYYQNILFLLMEDGKHTTYFESFVAHSFYFQDPSGMSLNSLHAFLILRMTLNFQELVRLGSFVMKQEKSLKHYQNII